MEAACWAPLQQWEWQVPAVLLPEAAVGRISRSVVSMNKEEDKELQQRHH